MGDGNPYYEFQIFTTHLWVGNVTLERTLKYFLTGALKKYKLAIIIIL